VFVQQNGRMKNEFYACQQTYLSSGIVEKFMCAKCWSRFVLLLFYFFLELASAASAGDSYWNCEIKDQAMRCSSSHPLLADAPYEGLEQKLTLALICPNTPKRALYIHLIVP
jgi:hypothetical protein